MNGRSLTPQNKRQIFNPCLATISLQKFTYLLVWPDMEDLSLNYEEISVLGNHAPHSINLYYISVGDVGTDIS